MEYIPSTHIFVLQLNLKNDTLRRRYDSLKYDIKKIEEGKLIFLFSPSGNRSLIRWFCKLYMTYLFGSLHPHQSKKPSMFNLLEVL